MSTNDITPVVNRLLTIIQSVPGVGLVYGHDIYSHDDLADLVVSEIAGEPTLRAWWISGPRMDSERLTQTAQGYIERTWTYEIHGVEGLSDDGDSLLDLRTHALAITDAIDIDIPLSGACHRSKPCRWRTAPENRVLWVGVACGYAVIEKPVITVSTP